MLKSIYLAKFGDIYKIGCSRSPVRRCRSIERLIFLKSKILMTRKNCGHVLETKIHKKLRKYLSYGKEWYEFNSTQLKEAKKVIKSVHL